MLVLFGVSFMDGEMGGSFEGTSLTLEELAVAVYHQMLEEKLAYYEEVTEEEWDDEDDDEFDRIMKVRDAILNARFEDGVATVDVSQILDLDYYSGYLISCCAKHEHDVACRDCAKSS